MNESKTIVKQTVSRDIGLRRSAAATDGTHGSKVGEEMHVEVTPDRIRVRAYEIYQARNGAPGDAESDWCQAERELDGQTDAARARGDSLTDPSVLEIKTRSEAQRQPETSVRGGL